MGTGRSPLVRRSASKVLNAKTSTLRPWIIGTHLEGCLDNAHTWEPEKLFELGLITPVESLETIQFVGSSSERRGRAQLAHVQDF